MSKKNITPAEFDFDAWLSGASRPTRSVKMYQRGDLLAERDELVRQIELAEQLSGGEVVEESLTDTHTFSDSEPLRERYAELLEEFHNSALEVRVTSLDRDERNAVLTEAIEAGVARTDEREFTLWLLAAGIQSPRVNVDQLRAMRAKVGDSQFDLVVEAYNELQSGEIEPSADFLPKRSSRSEPEES